MAARGRRAKGAHLRLRLRLVILAKKVSNAFSHEQGEVRPEQAHRVGMGGSFVENHRDEPAGRTSRSTFGKRMAARYLLGFANIWRT
jgi:hypothetical protein